jgi:hypothetical protein
VTTDAGFKAGYHAEHGAGYELPRGDHSRNGVNVLEAAKKGWAWTGCKVECLL